MYSINLLFNIILRKMFTSENVKKMATTLVIVMVGLALHQKFVAPMLTKKSPSVPAK